MTLSVKHTFTSPKADGTDSTLIQPSNWNAEHTITAAAGKVLGRDTSGTGSVQELPLAFDPTMQSMVPPTGTTAQRPVTATAGMLRYNTDLAKVELYNGTSWGSVGGGAAISDSGPANPQPGDLWWKSDEGQLYVYYNDGTSSQWVIANAFMGGTAFGDITVTSINSGPLAGSRNRIINGDMRIDQRNSGSAVTLNTGAAVYFIDRWYGTANGGGVFSAARSSVAPSDFSNSLSMTVSTVDSSIAASDYYTIEQRVEAFNTGDLNWGTAAAKAVTLSFWVRSSVAGTYALGILNASYNRSYPTTYTINNANTWEYKTVTIPGDTTGTWLRDTNSIGLIAIWDLGSGSNYSGTANAWAGSAYWRTTGSTNFISNNGATFYLTGVQLEVGSRATPFERRNYQQELAMCQRYYQTGGVWSCYTFMFGASVAPNYGLRAITFPVPMRAVPTVTTFNEAGTSGRFSVNRGGSYTAGLITEAGGFTITNGTGTTITSFNELSFYYNASAEL